MRDHVYVNKDVRQPSGNAYKSLKFIILTAAQSLWVSLSQTCTPRLSSENSVVRRSFRHTGNSPDLGNKLDAFVFSPVGLSRRFTYQVCTVPWAVQ